MSNLQNPKFLNERRWLQEWREYACTPWKMLEDVSLYFFHTRLNYSEHYLYEAVATVGHGAVQ